MFSSAKILSALAWVGLAACGTDSVAFEADGAAGAAGEAAVASVAGASPAADETGALSAAEQRALLFTREEEKLARDVYKALDAQDPVFANIAASEQTHMDTVATLLDRYGLDDPAAGMPVGMFEDETLQALHDRLVMTGQASALAALSVGLEIEELDIHDIENASADVQHADIQTAYDNLTRGSRNHLRSFYKRLSALGGSYEPQYLPREDFMDIATSTVEAGR